MSPYSVAKYAAGIGTFVLFHSSLGHGLPCLAPRDFFFHFRSTPGTFHFFLHLDLPIYSTISEYCLMWPDALFGPKSTSFATASDVNSVPDERFSINFFIFVRLLFPDRDVFSEIPRRAVAMGLSISSFCLIAIMISPSLFHAKTIRSHLQIGDFGQNVNNNIFFLNTGLRACRYGEIIMLFTILQNLFLCGSFIGSPLHSSTVRIDKASDLFKSHFFHEGYRV